jgi:hypothetical protein
MERNTERLVKAFRAGQLIKPGGRGIHFVDLVRALARLTGLEGVEASPGVLFLCRKIGKADHYIFVLIDGLGMNLVHRLPQHSLLRSGTVAELQAVFLSTTASALTTLATAQWPCFHSVPGWWTRLEKAGITAVTLSHVERWSQKPLSEFGLRVEDLFPCPSFWPQLRYEPLSILPADIVDSPFSNWARGGTGRVGYTELKEAVRIAREAILDASGPRFIFLYLPQVDTLSHRQGPEHEAVRELVLLLDRELSELVSAVAGRARIVISADHGQLQVPEADRVLLSHDDPILRYLKCAPTGETNVPIFHVRPDCEGAFAAEFSARFGEAFILLSLEHVERMRLLGPSALSPLMKERMGHFVAIAQKPACLCVGPPEESGFDNNGIHGGLSPGEMIVPLIIPG